MAPTDRPDGFFAVPQWVPDLISVNKNNVATLEITCTNRKYKAFLEFLALRAVDVDHVPQLSCDEPAISCLPELGAEGAPGTPVNASASSANAEADPAQGHSKPETNLESTISVVREHPGVLSCLFLESESSQYESDYSDSDTGSDNGEDEEEMPLPPTSNMQFGLGNARLRLKEDDVYVVHSAVGPPIGSSIYDVCVLRTLHFYARSPAVLRALSDVVLAWDHARNYVPPVHDKSYYTLYTLTMQCGEPRWEHRGYKKSRSLDSVILPDAMLDGIVEDFQKFTGKATRSWYEHHGLPYRRTHLFHGPPGVGKTSTIRALAGALEYNACFLSLGNSAIGNQELEKALNEMPQPSILVIEDVDALFNEARQALTRTPLTFSGLLNALDGLVSAEGIVTVMTTNHIDRLDPALIRAGRVDRKFEFGLPDKKQMAKFFKSFYPDAEDSLAERFAESVWARPEKEARSIATLQEHFIFTRENTAQECFDQLETFFKEFYVDAAQRVVERRKKTETVIAVEDSNGVSEVNENDNVANDNE